MEEISTRGNGSSSIPFVPSDNKSDIFISRSQDSDDEKSSVNFFRRHCLFLTEHPMFDNLSLLVITSNAILLACSDYSHVYPSGELDPSGSNVNFAIQQSDIVFTTLFTIEMILKMVALGASYFKIAWNNFDFFIVVVSWISLGPNVPGVKALRTMRVLRPLKSIKSYPSLASMVSAVFNSLVKLQPFFAMLICFVLFFGILGLHLFSGPYMHARCRLTPFPVNVSWRPGLDFDEYRCRNVPNFDYPGQNPAANKYTSPWHVPAYNCYWPIDNLDKQLCSLTSSGSHVCIRDEVRIPPELWRWCGSEFDAWGNFRFAHQNISALSTYSGDFGWSFINFDNFGMSALVVLQTLSLTGWTNPIMYMTQNSISSGLAATYFVAIVVIGPLFMLQLVVALVQESFKDEVGKFSQPRDESELISSLRRNLILIVRELRHFPGGNNFIIWISRLVDCILYLVSTFAESICIFPAFLRPWMEKLSALARGVIIKQSYEVAVQRLIFLNTVFLALDHYPMQDSFGAILDLGNFCLTLCYIVDMLLKVVGIGVVQYTGSIENIFDASIVISSVIELSFSSLPVLLTGHNRNGHGESTGGSLTVLRSLRLLRLLRLFKSKSFQKVLKKVVDSLTSLGSFGLLLLLYVFIMTLIGMQMFANKFRFDSNGLPISSIGSSEWKNAEDWPRHNFDSFTNSFATVFQTLTGDNWNNILYNSLRLGGNINVLFPVFNIASGFIVVASLITAMIVHNFSSSELGEEYHSVEENLGRESQISTFYSILTGLYNKIFGKMNASAADFAIVPSDVLGSVDSFSDSDSHGSCVSTRLRRYLPTLFLFIDTSREYCQAMVASFVFDYLSIFMIGYSSILLAIDSPLLDPSSKLVKFLMISDIFVTVYFSLEMCIKQHAMGIKSYFENGWNCLDCFVVVASLFSLNSNDSKFQRLKGLRALRALRPLRFINRFKGLQVIIKAFISAIPELSGVAFVCCAIYFLFAVFLVGYLKGQLRGCKLPMTTFPSYSDDNFIPAEFSIKQYLVMYPKSWQAMSEEERGFLDDVSPWNNCTAHSFSQPCCPQLGNIHPSIVPTSRVICECFGGQWKPTTAKLFDNVGMAMVNLFMLATLDNWSNSMWAIVDGSRGIDMEPIRNHAPYWVYVVIAFIVLGNFLCLNFFVGVLCKEFDKSAVDISVMGSAVMTEEQKQWAKTRAILLAHKPIRQVPAPTNSISVVCNSVACSRHFNLLMLSLIFAQALVLSMSFFGSTPKYQYSLFVANAVIGFSFVFEVVIRMIGRGIYGFFDDNWNRFDFAIATVIIVSFGFSATENEMLQSAEHFFVIARVFRLLKFAKFAQFSTRMQRLVKIVILSSPGILNIVGLLLLVLYIYSVLAMSLFAKVAYHNNYNSDANFRSFGVSMLTLLRFATGEGWSDVCYDLSYQEPYCVNDPPYNSEMCGFNDFPGCTPLNGCGSALAFPFLISFVLLIGVVFLNIFIAVVISNFHQMNDKSHITPEAFDKFSACWAKYDPKGTCVLSLNRLPDFIGELFEPWGFGGLPLYIGSAGLQLVDLSTVSQEYRPFGFSAKQLNRRIGKVHVYYQYDRVKYPDGIVLFQDVLLVAAASVFERQVQIFGKMHEKTGFLIVDRKNRHLLKPNTAFPASRRRRVSSIVDKAMVQEARLLEIDHWCWRDHYFASIIQSRFRARRIKAPMTSLAGVCKNNAAFRNTRPTDECSSIDISLSSLNSELSIDLDIC